VCSVNGHICHDPHLHRATGARKNTHYYVFEFDAMVPSGRSILVVAPHHYQMRFWPPIRQ